VRPFWIDPDRDREERYTEHVRANASDFADSWGDISPVGFAATAWRLAIPPELEPGYVRWHRRISSAWLWRNPWDGGLAATVILISPWPAELTWSKQWGRDRGWRDWPQVFGQYVLPTPRDIATHPHLRAALTVETPLALDGLPRPPDEPTDNLPALAALALPVLVRELNAQLEPLLAQLDGEVSDKATGP
jgi:hypothetical protein